MWSRSSRSGTRAEARDHRSELRHHKQVESAALLSPSWEIGHQRTEPHCPWMNGHVERFFGTLKEKLHGWAVDGREQLNGALGDFLAWYHHVRPHQHLGGRTPTEAWAGIDPYATAPKAVGYFSAWDGLLTGFYMRR